MSFSIGEVRRFDGVYIAHWEVSRFEVETEPRWFGLLRRVERCKLETAAEVDSLESKVFPDGLPEDWRHSAAHTYSMSFMGRAVRRGHFGHRGWCRWQLLVLEWLNVERREL